MLTNFLTFCKHLVSKVSCRQIQVSFLSRLFAQKSQSRPDLEMLMSHHVSEEFGRDSSSVKN